MLLYEGPHDWVVKTLEHSAVQIDKPMILTLNGEQFGIKEVMRETTEDGPLTGTRYQRWDEDQYPYCGCELCNDKKN